MRKTARIGLIAGVLVFLLTNMASAASIWWEDDFQDGDLENWHLGGTPGYDITNCLYDDPERGACAERDDSETATAYLLRFGPEDDGGLCAVEGTFDVMADEDAEWIYNIIAHNNGHYWGCTCGAAWGSNGELWVSGSKGDVKIGQPGAPSTSELEEFTVGVDSDDWRYLWVMVGNKTYDLRSEIIPCPEHAQGQSDPQWLLMLRTQGDSSSGPTIFDNVRFWTGFTRFPFRYCAG